MKYYWAKWKSHFVGPKPFVICINKDGLVYTVSGADPWRRFGADKDYLVNKGGLIIGPDIPGPPEEWV